MSKKPLKVIAGTPDRPLILGDVKIDCYVLEDETRVLTQRGVFRGIGAARGGPRNEIEAKADGAEMPRFAAQKWLIPFINRGLEMALKSPILFKSPNGKTAYGYPAEMLVDLLDAIMAAHTAGATTERQTAIIARANSLRSGLGKIGIDALVDEYTGYQRIRAENALATILEKFIAEDLQSWTKTFPYEFYNQIFRLKGWPGPDGVKRPSVIGHYTNDIVYDRLGPGVLEELQSRNPTKKSGGRSHKHHQWFTRDIGHPKLKEHLIGVMALMRAASTWDRFRTSLQRSFPKKRETIPMDLEES